MTENNDAFLSDSFIEDIEYVQAENLKELQKKGRKMLDKEFRPIEQNPFFDPQTNLWTQVYVLDGYGENEENK